MQVWPGSPMPLGATFDGEGTNFALFSSGATAVTLCLLDADAGEVRIALTEVDSLVWHAYLPGVGPGTAYGYRVEGPYEPSSGSRFNPAKFLLDPYAKALAGDLRWDPALFAQTPDGRLSTADSRAFMPAGLVIDPAFDWEGDRAPARPYHETLIYEAHVRGLTLRHPQVPQDQRGTYAGLAHPAVVEHLLGLGVTAVELMPVHWFVSEEPLVRRGLSNYWGYNTLAFFAPHARYAATTDPSQVPYEFKQMVRSLHAAGLEVILDVVFNHTAEGDHRGSTLSLRGIDNRAYYRLEEHDPSRYANFTGTGNSLNAGDHHALQLITDCLRYWVSEMHVDGFRFDLAAALARQLHDVDRLSIFFGIIQQDPVLSRVKLVAEPWDVGPGGYQVGNFPPGWSEWNGSYRDTVRDFWRGEPSTLGRFASRITGSSDLYEHTGRSPAASVNYVTAHDGFTLADLVSYNIKHNEANGEANTDGEAVNRSWNCGVEGPTEDPEVRQLRARQQRNFLATLLLSHGVPMLAHGDELGRTQVGNNNAYAQDSPLSWIDWARADPDLLDFTIRVARLRADHATFHRRRFFSGKPVPVAGSQIPDIVWFHPDGRPMTLEEWDLPRGRALALYLNGRGIRCSDLTGSLMTDSDFLLCFNSGPDPVSFRLPPAGYTPAWIVEIDTAGGRARSPVLSPGEAILAAGHSMLVLRDPADPVHAHDRHLHRPPGGR
ncbi:MAG: glycogen debranching protein GlgX [Propionibacterium sp.]